MARAGGWAAAASKVPGTSAVGGQPSAGAASPVAALGACTPGRGANQWRCLWHLLAGRTSCSGLRQHWTVWGGGARYRYIHTWTPTILRPASTALESRERERERDLPYLLVGTWRHREASSGVSVARPSSTSRDRDFWYFTLGWIHNLARLLLLRTKKLENKKAINALSLRRLAHEGTTERWRS